MLTGPNILLTLKIAVAVVTVLLLAAIAAAAQGNYRLHGRLNLIFFILTSVAVLSLEVVVRLLAPDVFDYINSDNALRRALNCHLWFSVPSASICRWQPASSSCGAARSSRASSSCPQHRGNIIGRPVRTSPTRSQS